MFQPEGRNSGRLEHGWNSLFFGCCANVPDGDRRKSSPFPIDNTLGESRNSRNSRNNSLKQACSDLFQPLDFAPDGRNTTSAPASAPSGREALLCDAVLVPQNGPVCPSRPPAPWCDVVCPLDRAPRALWNVWRRHFENRGHAPSQAAALARLVCRGVYPGGAT